MTRAAGAGMDYSSAGRLLCDHEGCDRPQYSPGGDPGIFRRCALHEIASYYEEDLRSGGEE
jgi:hypothetical protein